MMLFARFVANGLVAAAVHFAVLTFGMEVLHIPLAAFANLLAAIAGITCSFLGNRYFVFRQVDQPIMAQAARFAGLYAATAVIHALVLFVWTDTLALDYRIGFLLASGMQVVLSYIGNKYLVFK